VMSQKGIIDASQASVHMFKERKGEQNGEQ
jgi:hypothetical protein